MGGAIRPCGHDLLGDPRGAIEIVHGVGDKIGYLAARFLMLDFDNVTVWSGLSFLRPSPDRHVMRVFYRLGLIGSEDDIDGLYAASEAIRPSASIEADGAWEIGLSWCHSTKPSCSQGCPLSGVCPSAR